MPAASLSRRQGSAGQGQRGVRFCRFPINLYGGACSSVRIGEEHIPRSSGPRNLPCPQDARRAAVPCFTSHGPFHVVSEGAFSHAQAANPSARRRRTRAPSGVSERRERPPSLRAYPPPPSSSLQRVCLQHATEHEVGPARRQFRLGTGGLSLKSPPTVQGAPANCSRSARQLFKERPPTVQGEPANCARRARQLCKESPPTVQGEQGPTLVSREMRPLIALSHPAKDQPGSPEPQVGRALLARLDFKRARPSRRPAAPWTVLRIPKMPSVEELQARA